MSKLSYDEVMTALNEERAVDREDVQAAVLRRKVWVGMSNFPGCMPEYRGYSRTKQDAIESMEFLFEPWEDKSQRGWKTALQKYEAFSDDRMNYTIERASVSDLL